MSDGAIIDVSGDPTRNRRERRRRLAIASAPFLAILLVLSGIVAVTLYGYQINKRDVLLLSGDLVTALDERVQTEVQSYLRPADHAVRFAGTVAEAGAADAEGRFERFALALLEQSPSFAAAYVGDPAGNFTMVQRNEDGGLDTKHIRQRGAEHESSWVRRNAEGQVTGTEIEPDDDFAPPTRPWFRGAADSPETYWTEVYVFFTSQQPGITAAHAVRNEAGDLTAVVGVDIRLDQLSHFLAQLKIGQTGRAFLIEEDGRIVATPDRDVGMKEENGELRTALVAELDDAVLRGAFDRVRVSRDTRSIMTLDGERYVIAASSLGGILNRSLWLIILVPEEDFTGFLASNIRQVLLLSLGVIALAVLLALLLSYQNLSAKRQARALAARQVSFARIEEGYEKLAGIGGLHEPDNNQALQQLTELLAQVLGARRTSLWALQADGTRLFCLDCYDGETRGHTVATRIEFEDCPEIFETLSEDTPLFVEDADRDRRTQSLYLLYLKQVDSQSLLSVPVGEGGRSQGVIWVEDPASGGPTEQAGATALLRVAARLLVPRFAQEGSADATTDQGTAWSEAHADADARPKLPDDGAGLRTASISALRDRQLLQEISRRSLDKDQLAAALFPGVTVLTLSLSDDLVIGTRASQGPNPVIEQIVSGIQEIAEGHGIRYLKILTDQIVAAEGFDQPGRETLVAMGHMALQVQRECTRIFAAHARLPSFSIGMDHGSVMGSAIGFGTVAYNIWGEPLRMASLMASTAPASTIHLTEAAYDGLKGDFIVRRRGGFYLEKVGEMTTFLLRGEV